jgi:hypothetical protein
MALCRSDSPLAQPSGSPSNPKVIFSSASGSDPFTMMGPFSVILIRPRPAFSSGFILSSVEKRTPFLIPLSVTIYRNNILWPRQSLPFESRRLILFLAASPST